MMKNDEGESGKEREIEGGRIDRSSRGKFSHLEGFFFFFLNMQFSNIFRSYDDSPAAVVVVVY